MGWGSYQEDNQNARGESQRHFTRVPIKETKVVKKRVMKKGVVKKEKPKDKFDCAGCSASLRQRNLEGICDACFEKSLVYVYIEGLDAYRRRAKSDAFRMRTLGMSLRQFCAYKIHHNLDGRKVYWEVINDERNNSGSA